MCICIRSTKWWGSQSSSCNLGWPKTSSAASSDEFILNMASAVVTEKQTSCPEACRALVDTSVPAHRVSRRSSRAIMPHSARHGKSQQSLKDGLGDQLCPHKLERTNDTCNQTRLHRGGNGVSLPTDLPLHGRGPPSSVQGLSQQGRSSVQRRLSAAMSGACC